MAEKNKTMLTDLYQLTMNASYFDNNKDDEATFELFFRKLPKDWGYFIANGIEDGLDYVTNLKFKQDDIDYLENQGIFKNDFLDFLKNFNFDGDIYAVKEGTPIFPNEPVMIVKGKRTQSQFLETLLLNTINFQTMIASKASRIVNAAKGANIVEFGLRRAQDEDAAMKGARATYIAGCVATSNVKAGKEYGIPISGTHAHSFVMSFEKETDAFRAYVKTFPNNATLLIDTYDTIEGAKNAVIVGKELEKKGNKLGAVRLDSGDITDLSIKVRRILDETGLNYVKIFASNDLNEYKIDEMIKNGARIDAYGVGTELITAKPIAAIPGVYKLVEDNSGAKIKLSPGKKTYPGEKKIYRIIDNDGEYKHDVLALKEEKIKGIPLLEKVVENGKRISERRDLKEIRQYSLDCVARLPCYIKQVVTEKPYEMKISYELNDLVEKLTQKYSNKNGGM